MKASHCGIFTVKLFEPVSPAGTRLGMKSTLERQVMENLYIAGIMNVKRYFRAVEICNLTGIPKSTLQRVLPRLEKIGWLEKVTRYSYLDSEPTGKIEQGFLLRNTKTRKIDIRIKSMQAKYNERFPKLRRRLVKQPIKGEKTIEKQTFFEVFSKFSPTKQRRIRKTGMPFKGVAALNRKILKEEKVKKYTWYKIKEFPFITRIKRGTSRHLADEIILAWNVPKRKKRFWQNSAKDMKYLTKKWKQSIPRLEVSLI